MCHRTGLTALCLLSLASAASLADQPPTGLLEPVTLRLWDFETKDELDVWKTEGVQATLCSQWAYRNSEVALP